jgi:hypothetical protein
MFAPSARILRTDAGPLNSIDSESPASRRLSRRWNTTKRDQWEDMPESIGDLSQFSGIAAAHCYRVLSLAQHHVAERRDRCQANRHVVKILRQRATGTMRRLLRSYKCGCERIERRRRAVRSVPSCCGAEKRDDAAGGFAICEAHRRWSFASRPVRMTDRPNLNARSKSHERRRVNLVTAGRLSGLIRPSRTAVAGSTPRAQPLT